MTEELDRQVRRARRRLRADRFLAALGWCWLATLSVALAIIAVGKFWPIGIAESIWGAGAIVLGLAAAIGWVAATGPGALEAAIEIDRRFGLRERVSSALAMTDSERQSEMGRALAADAARRIQRINVRERMPISFSRRLLLPLLPGVLAILVAWWAGPAVVENPAAATTDKAAVQQQVKKSTSVLARKLAERQKIAQKEGLKDAEQLLKRLEDRTKDLGTASDGDRRKALVQLNDLAQQLKERRDKLGGTEKVKQQLNQLRDLGLGPADKIAKAMARGEFKQAVRELEALKKQLAEGKLSEKEKQELVQQLNKMQEKLQKMTEAHQAVQRELEKKIEELRAAGRKEEASKLEEQLDKLRQQLPQMKSLDKLAEKMGKCSKSLQNGQMKDAAAALGEAEEGLGQMQKEADELKILDESLSQMADARDMMNCEKCGGLGCPACMGKKGDKPGFGMGAGTGQGDRPEEKNDTAFRNSQVKQKVGRGAASVVDLVEGPNVKGQVGLEIQQQVESARRESTDPLTDQRMPRKHREHAKEYFDRFREGK